MMTEWCCQNCGLTFPEDQKIETTPMTDSHGVVIGHRFRGIKCSRCGYVSGSELDLVLPPKRDIENDSQK